MKIFSIRDTTSFLLDELAGVSVCKSELMIQLRNSSVPIRVSFVSNADAKEMLRQIEREWEPVFAQQAGLEFTSELATV